MIERVTKIARANNMPIVFPGRMVYTRRALEATEYARGKGKALDFKQVVFQKLFGQGEDIGRWPVLRAAAEEVGLDPDEMQQLTASGVYNMLIEREKLKAQKRGINEVPTYVLNDNYAVAGVQPLEVFQLVLEQMKKW